MVAKKSKKSVGKKAPPVLALTDMTIASDDEVNLEVESEAEASEDEKDEMQGEALEFDDGRTAQAEGWDFMAALREIGGRGVAKDQKVKPQDGETEDDHEQPDEAVDLPDDNIKALREDAPVKGKKTAAAKKSKKKKQQDEEDEAKDDDAEAVHEPQLDDDEEELRKQQEAAYFEQVVGPSDSKEVMFSQLNLSRPLLRAVEAMGYVTPTPIQSRVIPIALAGRDICGSAVTGSGKTAAFLLPSLERLLFRPRDAAAIRVLVITPTRELATQCHQVLQKLSQFTDITSVLITGGTKNVKAQEATLRMKPDVVICTPGRMIDHLRNSQSVDLDDLDILILDEVDRLLQLGFQQEIEELVRHCPTQRQTMLFSATMTTSVEDLIKLSLNKPVRIKADLDSLAVAPRLVQEFIKIRPKQEDEREAILVSLLKRTFTKRVIVFVDMKSQARRIQVVLSKLGVNSAEMHGNLTQEERLMSLQRFKDGEVDVLVCTDVAARGLDIPRVQAVVNFEMPRSAETYVHRVGRTARAGCGGRSVTLVGEGRRKIMKEVLKSASTLVPGEDGELKAGTNPQQQTQILARSVPADVVAHFVGKIQDLEDEIQEELNTQKIVAQTQEAEMQAERAANILQHEDEIAARPARTWFQSAEQKLKTKQLSKELADQEAQNAAGKKKHAVEDADDYRDSDDEKGGKGKRPHRLTRQKRRRLEALRELADDDDGKDADNDLAVTRSIKKQKKAAQEKTHKQAGKIAGEAGSKRQRFAVGGFDVDLQELTGGASTTKLNRKSSTQETFRGFDPDKRLRHGGKQGHQAFKSKKRYRRR